MSYYTCAQIEEIHKQICATANISFDRHGMLPMFGVVFYPGGLAQTMIFPEITCAQHKDAVALLCRMHIERGAEIVALASECWYVETRAARSSEAVSKLKAEVGDYIGRLHEHPDRKEAVVVDVHTRQGQRKARAFIIREEGKPPRLDDFTFDFKDVPFDDSRFGNFFKQVEARHAAAN